MHFGIERSEHSGLPMLVLSGEFDMAAHEALSERLSELVESDGCAILHMNAITYTDASTVGLFMSARDKFRSHGGHLAFVCCESQVLRILESLGLLKHVDVFDDLEEAGEFLRNTCA